MADEEIPTTEGGNDANPANKNSTYMADIFGEDSDDDNVVSMRRSNPQSVDDDAIFGDSDDDEAPARGTSRLRKGNQSKSTTSHRPSTSLDDDDDIDDDELAAFGIKKRRKEKQNKRLKKRSRVGGSDERPGGDRQNKKRRPGGDGDDYNGAASGDEYDSGEEVTRTAEDDNFIDDDDDLGDIVGEYDADDQNFDDERPDRYRKKGKSKGGGGGGGGGGRSGQESQSSGSRKSASDPFSQLLETMKKPKAAEMSDQEKDRVADKLLHRMHDAYVKDEDCFRQGLPAVHKLQLLKSVQQITSMKSMQHSLLEKDILGSLRDWIEPKKDANKTLPSLAVRSAVFEILMKLPCQTDHLKRSDGDKKPIGHTILALRKHKMETPENKMLLKQLMEKWCRPVFGKSADARNMTHDAATKRELEVLAGERQRRAAEERLKAESASHTSARAPTQAESRGESLDAALSGTLEVQTDNRNRARTPFSSGFLFTVQPDEKNVQRKESNEKVFGQTRALLMKKMKESKGGAKLNPRAMDMATNGRNKF